MRKRVVTCVVSLFVSILAASGVAFATDCDLTTAGASCTINGAVFTNDEPQPVGSGVIDSFVRINSNETFVQGYNTTANNVFDTQSTDTFDHELLLGLVETVACDAGLCYKFNLDINQQGTDPLLSLDEVQIWTSAFPNGSIETCNGGGACLPGTMPGLVDLDDAPVNGTLVYQLDGGGDNEVLLNYLLNAGSGGGDMFMLVPVSAFGIVDPNTTYVYLYSAFGGKGGEWINNDGYEEWYRNLGAGEIPEPASLFLLGTGLVGLGAKLRRRTKKS